MQNQHNLNCTGKKISHHREWWKNGQGCSALDSATEPLS